MKKKRRKIVNLIVPTSTSSKCPSTAKHWRQERVISSPSVGRLSSAPDVTSGSDNSLILKSVTEEDERPGLLASAFFKKSKAGGGGPSDTNYIRFLHHLTDNLLVKWESILLESRLYIQLPETSLHQGGRDSLVELLDIAEEQLGCSQVIIMFARERSDVAQLMRNFKFLGFETLPPGHQWLPPATDQFFMAYNI